MPNAVGDASEFLGVLQDEIRQIRDGSLPLEALKGFVAHRQIRRFALGETVDSTFKDLRDRWEEEYTCDLSDVLIPEPQDGFDWLIIVRKGLWPNEAYERLQKLKIPLWRYTENLNDIISVREPFDRSYGVWLKKRQEADDEFRNKSFDDVWRSVNGITITEYFVAERDWFKQSSGGHLDENSLTFCTGSRLPVGLVPSVNWHDGKVCVDWSNHVDAGPGMGARQVVS